MKTEKNPTGAGARRNKLNDAALIEAKSTIARISEALEEVLEGDISMTEACQNRGLDYKSTRNILLSKAFEKCRMEQPPVKLEDARILDPDGYEKLYMDVFEINDIGKIELPPDYKTTVLEVLQSLNDREWNVICMRYGIGKIEEPMILEAVGKEFGVTRDRIRQIENKALRKLRHSSRAKWLTEGSIKYHAEKEASEAAIAEHKKAVDKWLAEQLTAAKQEAEHPKTIKELDMNKITINDMDLSVRTYNCLKRAGKNTLMDIVQMSESDFMRVRNLGRRSMEEIIRKRDALLEDIAVRQKMREDAE